MFIFICVCACVGASACHMDVPGYRSQKGCWSPRRLWVLGTQFKWFSKSRKLLHIEPCVPSLQTSDKPVYLIFKAFGISNKEHVHGWALGMTGYYLHVIYGIVFEIPLDCPSNCGKCARFQSNTCLYIIWEHQVKQMCHLLKSQGVWHPGTSCQSGNPFISTSWPRDPFLLLPPWDAALASEASTICSRGKIPSLWHHTFFWTQSPDPVNGMWSGAKDWYGLKRNLTIRFYIR